MNNNKYLFSGNLQEDSRVVITVSGEWNITGTGVSSENFRAKERIVRNMNVPGWIKKAVADGKAVMVSKVEKKAEDNYYVVRGDVLEVKTERVEKVEPSKSLGANVGDSSANPSCLCIHNWEEVDKVKLIVRHYDRIEWSEVLFAGDEEVGTLNSGYEYKNKEEEDVTSQFLPKIRETMSCLDSEYFSEYEKIEYVFHGDGGLEVKKKLIKPFIRFEININGSVYMSRLDAVTILKNDDPMIPVKEKIVGEERIISTTESYISGGDGYRRGLRLERPVKYVVADITYIYENGESFVDNNVRLREV